MPHTSRKEKQGPKRRMQITDDSGWTHITKSTIKHKYQKMSTSWSPSDEQFKPTDIPRGLTLNEVFDYFDRYTLIWKESSCWKNLKAILEDHDLQSNIKITKCVCLGLGSFTGGDRTDMSLFELAALVSILEMLNDVEQVYMQDPVFNSMDENFLRCFAYEIISSPNGFEEIDDTTFLFAPHLEWPIYQAALQQTCPALCIGNDVREYLDSPIGSASDKAKTVFQNFIERCSYRAMPQFDRSSWCDYTSVYRRRPLLEDGEIGEP